MKYNSHGIKSNLSKLKDDLNGIFNSCDSKITEMLDKLNGSGESEKIMPTLTSITLSSMYLLPPDPVCVVHFLHPQ